MVTLRLALPEMTGVPPRLMIVFRIWSLSQPRSPRNTFGLERSSSTSASNPLKSNTSLAVISPRTDNPRALAMGWILVLKLPFERPKPFFSEFPSYSSCQVVGADHCAVDHLYSIKHYATFIECLKDHFLQACERPTAELALNTGPFAKLFRQVPPRRASAGNPVHRIQHTAVVCRLTTTTSTNCNKKRFKERPFGVFH